jgi:hypothetical protein
MGIAERYREFIANKILIEYLLDQTNPTISQLESDLRKVDEWFTDMSKPQISFKDADVEEREESSASKFNETQDSLSDDLHVLYQHTAAQIDSSVQFLNRNLSEVSMLKSVLKELEDEVDQLLLANKDTEGYFQFFMDSFKSLKFVDLTSTTAEVDLNGAYVMMKEGLASRVKHNLNFLEASDINFTILTIQDSHGRVETQSLAADNIVDAFKDGEAHWRQTVTTTGPMTVTVELKVDIGENKDVSKIEFVNFQDDAYSAVTVHVQYSNDNYNWFDWPGEPFVQNIRAQGTYTATATRMRWVKFEITRSGYDALRDGKYDIDFGAKRISFFGLDYDITGSRLQSKAIQPEGRDGQIGYINRVSIESCEDLPQQTDVLWYVSFDDGGEWIPISPVQRTDVKFSQVVSLQKIKQQFNGPYGYTTPTEQVNNEDIVIDFDATTLDPLSTAVWRNIGEVGNVDTVRTVQKGWQFDDEFYACYVWVESFAGHAIDLGETEAELNGAIVSGKVTIPHGRHYFRTRQKNWFSLGELTEIDQDITDEGELNDTVVGSITDPLYPFNHKYLIEGVPYQDDLEGKDERTRIYLGVSRFAGERPEMISAFDLTENARADDYTLVAKSDNRFLLKHNPAAEDAANEEFLLQSFFSSATDLPTSVLVRADLTSEQPGVSPVLYDYKVKFDAYYETT